MEAGSGRLAVLHKSRSPTLDESRTFRQPVTQDYCADVARLASSHTRERQPQSSQVVVARVAPQSGKFLSSIARRLARPQCDVREMSCRRRLDPFLGRAARFLPAADALN